MRWVWPPEWRTCELGGSEGARAGGSERLLPLESPSTTTAPIRQSTPVQASAMRFGRWLAAVASSAFGGC